MTGESPNPPDIPPAPWCEPGGTTGRLRRPITEDWLRAHEFRIEDNRNDPRLPLRRLAVGADFVNGRTFMGASDDLCIDVAPSNDGEWYVWIMQVEPYRFLPVRMMKHTWELARLYEGLTGRLWPGTH